MPLKRLAHFKFAALVNDLRLVAKSPFSSRCAFSFLTRTPAWHFSAVMTEMPPANLIICTRPVKTVVSDQLIISSAPSTESHPATLEPRRRRSRPSPRRRHRAGTRLPSRTAPPRTILPLSRAFGPRCCRRVERSGSEHSHRRRRSIHLSLPPAPWNVIRGRRVSSAGKESYLARRCMHR